MNFTKNKFIGYQNTLNQIDTHYKLGTNPTLFETTSMNKYRDNSKHRPPVFVTKNAKDY